MILTTFGLSILLLGTILVQAADPDPLSDNPSNTTDAGFTLQDIFTNGDVSNGPGGLRAALNTRILPGLTSQGITYVQFRMVPCGVNEPHTHPRATEILTLVSGGPLQAGFIDTSGVAHITILRPGAVTVFPRGLLHFEINVGNETAFYISALNSQNPGTLVAADALFQVPLRTLASALNVELNEANELRENARPYATRLELAPSSICVPGRDICTEI